MAENYIGNAPVTGPVVSLDALTVRVAAIEAQLAASVLIRRLYVGTQVGGVLTQQRSLGGITVARTGVGLYTVTLAPAEANANYANLVGSGITGGSGDIGVWASAPQAAQTVNGFSMNFVTWSTARVMFDPSYIFVAVL